MPTDVIHQPTPVTGLEAPTLAERALLRAGDVGAVLLAGEQIPETESVVENVLSLSGPSVLDVSGSTPVMKWLPYSIRESTLAREGFPSGNIHIKGLEAARGQAQQWLNAANSDLEALCLESIGSTGDADALPDKIRLSEDAINSLVQTRANARIFETGRVVQKDGTPRAEFIEEARLEVQSLNDAELLSFWATAHQSAAKRSEFWAERLQADSDSSRTIESDSERASTSAADGSH